MLSPKNPTEIILDETTTTDERNIEYLVKTASENELAENKKAIAFDDCKRSLYKVLMFYDNCGNFDGEVCCKEEFPHCDNIDHEIMFEEKELHKHINHKKLSQGVNVYSCLVVSGTYDDARYIGRNIILEYIKNGQVKNESSKNKTRRNI